jgi:hypothetical protein
MRAQDDSIRPFAFVPGSYADWAFGGEHIIDSAFEFGPNLALAEDQLAVVWSFHASTEASGPWVAELWRTIGSANGVFFHINRDDEDGELITIGRVDAATAIERGLAML